MASIETNRRLTRACSGQRWERRAEAYLVAQGMRCVTRNHRCRGGEIDLVMLAADTLVFVEVRYRRGTRFGTAAETIDTRKQQRIVHAAQHFLMLHHEFANSPCRFDVIALYGDARAPGCDWIAGAFSA